MRGTPLIQHNAQTGITVEIPDIDAGDLDIAAAMTAMQQLEGGTIANPSEGRQVGHYWLRDPDLAPSGGSDIRAMQAQVAKLCEAAPTQVLLVGIGGSSLGPELAIDALAADPCRFVVLDSVDPAGIAATLRKIDPARTTVIVASKSGRTVETRTGLRAVQAHWAEANRDLSSDAIAITSPGSQLAQLASDWRAVLPVWDWVGGRTSITSAVGLLPMGLMGIDTQEFLAGAAAMDSWNRQPDSPAIRLATAWVVHAKHHCVFQPYADQLRHLGRYLQQLIMESVGKSHTRDGAPIHHGKAVYGNKGSADQHALVQQLRDGPDDILVHFIGVRPAPTSSALLMEAADTQFSLLHGTQRALQEVGRPTVGITLSEISPRTLGALIALFERTVGLYAELININAYDQPGVEAGKRAAKDLVLDIARVTQALSLTPQTSEKIAEAAGLSPQIAWHICMHLTSAQRASRTPGFTPLEDCFSKTE